MIPRTVAIFGGTFDPVHFGHLRTALEIKQRWPIDEMRLLPCNVPPHRRAPQCDAGTRLRMLRLALAGQSDLLLDEREIERAGTSFMVDTLASLREEFEDSAALILVLGMDAFAHLDSWHEWERIPELAHVLVVSRPGSTLPNQGVMARFVHAREALSFEELTHSTAGRVWLQELKPLDISATDIRELIAAGRSARYLLPDSVWDYIHQHKLYQVEHMKRTHAD